MMTAIFECRLHTTSYSREVVESTVAVALSFHAANTHHKIMDILLCVLLKHKQVHFVSYAPSSLPFSGPLPSTHSFSSSTQHMHFGLGAFVCMNIFVAVFFAVPFVSAVLSTNLFQSRVARFVRYIIMCVDMSWIYAKGK